jgi:hypothetical protein
LAEPIGIHQVPKHIDWARLSRQRVSPLFVLFNQQHEQLGQALLLCCALLLAEEAFQPSRAAVVLDLGVDHVRQCVS